MTDVLLGLIALGTLTTAVVQVVAIVSLLRAGKHTIERLERIKVMVAPLPAHLAAIRDDVERMQIAATRQMGKIAAIYDVVAPPLRHGMTAFAVVRTLAGLLSGRRRR